MVQNLTVPLKYYSLSISIRRNKFISKNSGTASFILIILHKQYYTLDSISRDSAG